MSTVYEKALEKYGYAALGDLEAGQMTSVFGIIIHTIPIKPPTFPRKSEDRFKFNSNLYESTVLIPIFRIDYHCSLKITDPTLKGSSITVNFFRSDSSQLPKANVGDIVFMRDIKVTMFNNHLQMTNEQDMCFVCIDPRTRKAKIPEGSIMPFTRTDAEIAALLYQWSKTNTSQVQAAKAVSLGRPTLTTQAIYETPSSYFNYVGMVVGCYPESRGAVPKTNLLLTDFTDNPIPYMDDKGASQLGVASTQLLQCTLWDENSVKCPKLEFGNYVFLDNCCRNQKNRSALEISMRGERNHNGTPKVRVKVLHPRDPLLRDLLERKAKYAKGNDRLRATESQDVISWDDSPLRTKIKELKGHTTLKAIKEAQQPGLYLTRATITKISPANVRDWIVGQCEQCMKFFKDPISLCDTCGRETIPTFKVVFNIYDGTDQVPLIVFGPDAEVLFSGLSAEDTCVDEDSMKQLRKIAKLIRQEDKDIYYDIGLCCYDTPGFGPTFRITQTELVENR